MANRAETKPAAAFFFFFLCHPLLWALNPPPPPPPLGTWLCSSHLNLRPPFPILNIVLNYHLLTVWGFVASKHANENNKASGLYRRERPCYLLFTQWVPIVKWPLETHICNKCCSFFFLFQIPLGTRSNRLAARNVTHTLLSLLLWCLPPSAPPTEEALTQEHKSSQSGAKTARLNAQWGICNSLAGALFSQLSLLIQFTNFYFESARQWCHCPNFLVLTLWMSRDGKTWGWPSVAF